MLRNPTTQTDEIDIKVKVATKLNKVKHVNNIFTESSCSPLTADELFGSTFSVNFTLNPKANMQLLTLPEIPYRPGDIELKLR